LVTGSTYNAEDNSFLLSGYNKNGNPFLLYLKDVDIQTLFNGVIERTDITASVGLASQIEGVAHINKGKYFLSRELVNRNINGSQVVLPQHLFRFDNGSFSTLSIDDYILDTINIYPNPSKELIQITGISIEEICIIDELGRKILVQKKSSNQIRINKLTTGTYILKVMATNKKIYTKKFIKN
jgi:hypothetical protein